MKFLSESISFLCIDVQLVSRNELDILMMSISSFHLLPRGSLGRGPGLLGSNFHVNSAFAFGNFVQLSPAEIPYSPL